MKLFRVNEIAGWKRGLVAALLAGAITSVYAEGFRFGLMGDHRGYNQKTNVNDTQTAYKDGGITKPVLISLATALGRENLEFVLDVGDMATKWQKGYFASSVTSNSLMAAELADWASLWIANSGNLPIYPVRGNQEVSAAPEVWRAFTATLPGISTLPLNGSAGEEGLTYAFNYKNCLFVGIDQYVSPLANNDSHVITPQALAWLKWVIPQSDHKFVFGHAPAFEVWNPATVATKTAIKDGLASPYALFNAESLAQRNAFWDLLGKHRANYFCGHDHIYTRALCADTRGEWVRQVIIGDGGAPAPAMFSTVYDTLGWFAEAYAGIPFPTVAGFSYQLERPLVLMESMPMFVSGTTRTYGFGYVVIGCAFAPFQ